MSKPKKTTVNLIVDVAILVLMLTLACTGLVVRYTLPPGSGGHGGGRGLLLWGMDRHEWGGVHFWLAVALLVLLVLHVALHWGWVCGVCFRWAARAAPRRVASGTAFLLAIAVVIGGFAWCTGASVEEHRALAGAGRRPAQREVPASPAEPPVCGDLPGQTACEPPFEPGSRRSGRQAARGQGRGVGRTVEGVTIRGFMTLGEVSAATGVPTGRLKAAMGLPPSAPNDERLGRLRRRFGFTMEDLRRALETARR